MAMALISIFCPDRTGLIAAITRRLYELDVNLGDMNFAVLGAGAKFTSLCELPQGLTLEHVAAELKALPEIENAEITVEPFALDPIHGPTGHVTHRILVRGADRPGLIANLCEALVGYRTNVVRLDAETVPSAQGGEYVARFAVSIPEASAEACLATVTNTAQSLQLSCSWEKV
jgi:glycine cleavage system transcriptional repressor